MKKLLLLSMLVLSSNLAFAQGKDYAQGNRLYINGKPLFISGMNIAWNTDSFGNDVGDTPLDVNAFADHIRNVRMAGGNAVRWWLHTDASRCPKINSNGQVTGIGSKTIENIRKALDIAEEYGVVVSLTLFSFDLLQPENKASYSSYNIDNNEKFLTEPANLDTYIENALRPILDAVGSHPAIMCWEVFNEPEGMITRASGGSGWASRTIDYSHVIRFTAKIAAEVHKRTTKMVSTGIHEFNKQNYFPKYTVAKLKEAAGGDEEAYLDFYMAHHYPEYIGPEGSPFKNPASFWELEKPVLIGEFPARDWSPPGFNWTYNMTIIDAYEYAYNNGYCGAMSWSLTEGNVAKLGGYETTAPALTNLFEKHQDDIMIKDVEIEVLTGDLAMKLAITNLPYKENNWSELGTNQDLNFSGKSNLTFEMFIKSGSGTNLDINVVLKIGNNWDWTPSSSTLKLNNYEQGKWVTVTVPISSFGDKDLSAVKSVLFQYGASGNPYSGEILFDNVKLDGAVISDFDNAKAWSLVADNSVVSIVKKDATTPIISAGPSYSTNIDLKTLDFSKAQVYDMRGKRVFANNFAELKNGIYIVKFNGIVKKFSVSN
jgi:hypothetical protein